MYKLWLHFLKHTFRWHFTIRQGIDWFSFLVVSIRRFKSGFRRFRSSNSKNGAKQTVLMNDSFVRRKILIHAKTIPFIMFFFRLYFGESLLLNWCSVAICYLSETQTERMYSWFSLNLGENWLSIVSKVEQFIVYLKRTSWTMSRESMESRLISFSRLLNLI